MSVLDKPTASWSESDLQALCDQSMREGPRLEFKRELSLATNDQKSEVERDAVGMANSGGGHIVYGIAEITLEDGATGAGSLTPIADGGLVEQLNNVLDSRCDPRLAFDVYAIDAANGGSYIVVELFGHRRPHMANDGRFHVRRNLLVRRMTAAEVAEAHREKVCRDAKADGFVTATVGTDPFEGDLDARIHRGLNENELAMYVAGGGDPRGPGWLSLSVSPVPLREELLDPVQVPAERLQGTTISDPWYGEQPLTHYWLQADTDKFRAQLPPRDDVAPAYLIEIWSDGLMEFGTTLEPSLRYEEPELNRRIATRSVADYIHDFSMLFFQILNDVEYDGRVKARVSFDNVRGHRLAVEQGRHFLDLRPIATDSVEGRIFDGQISEIPSQFGPWLKHSMDKLFLAGGIDTGAYFLTSEGELAA